MKTGSRRGIKPSSDGAYLRRASNFKSATRFSPSNLFDIFDATETIFTATMAAPTALLQRLDDTQIPENQNAITSEQINDMVLDPAAPFTTNLETPPQDGSSSTDMQIDAEGAPLFPPAKDSVQILRVETRKVLIPPHRFTRMYLLGPLHFRI